jgi:hypothetical protein
MTRADEKAELFHDLHKLGLSNIWDVGSACGGQSGCVGACNRKVGRSLR